jgi:hypothetical protein
MYSYNNQFPIAELPHRLRKDDGSTVTDLKSLDNEELLELGYVQIDSPPIFSDSTHKLEWSGTEWQVEELTEQELLNKKNELSQKARDARDERFDLEYWRIERYHSEVRLGLTPTEDIVHLDNYFQALRDITKQEEFPYNIDWPDIGEVILIEEPGFVDPNDESN